VKRRGRRENCPLWKIAEGFFLFLFGDTSWKDLSGNILRNVDVAENGRIYLGIFSATSMLRKMEGFIWEYSQQYLCGGKYFIVDLSFKRKKNGQAKRGRQGEDLENGLRIS